MHTTVRSLRHLVTVLVLGTTALGPDTAFAHPVHPVLALLRPVLEGTVNVNTASAEELARLPGIGPAIAGRIIAYREQHPFRNVTQLMRVKGIGAKTFAAIRPYLTLDGETTLREVAER